MDDFINLFGLVAGVVRQMMLFICSPRARSQMLLLFCWPPPLGTVPDDVINLFGPRPKTILLICSVGFPDGFINLFVSGSPNGDIIK